MRPLLAAACVLVIAWTLLSVAPARAADWAVMDAVTEELDKLIARCKQEDQKAEAQRSPAVYRELRTRVDALMGTLSGTVSNRSAGQYIRLMGRLADFQAKVGLAQLRGSGSAVEKDLREIDRRRAAAEAEREATVRARKWPPAIEQAVLAGQILVGMTPEQVKLAWGDPDQVSDQSTPARRAERWVYQGTTLLFFENDRLARIQQGR